MDLKNENVQRSNQQTLKRQRERRVMIDFVLTRWLSKPNGCCGREENNQGWNQTQMLCRATVRLVFFFSFCVIPLRCYLLPNHRQVQPKQNTVLTLFLELSAWRGNGWSISHRAAQRQQPYRELNLPVLTDCAQRAAARSTLFRIW